MSTKLAIFTAILCFTFLMLTGEAKAQTCYYSESAKTTVCFGDGDENKTCRYSESTGTTVCY